MAGVRYKTRMLIHALLPILVPIWAIITIISLYVYFKMPVRDIPIKYAILRLLFYIFIFMLIVLLIELLILVVGVLDMSIEVTGLTYLVIILFLPLLISRKLFTIATKYENTEANQNIVWITNQLGIASLFYVPAIPVTMIIKAFVFQ